MVDFRQVPSPDGARSTVDMRVTSDFTQPVVLAAQDQAPLSPRESQPAQKQDQRIAAAPAADEPATLGRFEVIDHSGELTVVYRRSKLLRTDVDVYRTAVVDPSICEIVQYTPREISVIGNGQGATHVTFWFEDGSFRPVTYLVRVVPDPEVHERREEQFGLLEEHLAELFPESKVKLLVLADKLIVKGQARDAEEAAQILAVIRGQAVRERDLLAGRAAAPFDREETNQAMSPIQVINMLRIPGVHQVALRVKIAELNRSASRSIGVDLEMNFSQGELLLRSLINAAAGGTASILGSFDGGDLEFGIHYLEEHGVIRMLSEPTLVTLSGRPATFIAGGEFAVPTTVGVGGAAAVTTDFRAFGAIISFLPVVLDKDHIRLEVAPEFSQINQDNAVNGTPGLDTRAVTTTVEMREGQTLAIAGLLDESMKADKEGDLPWISQIFGRRNVDKNETELIILVTPELIHPMEPEAVPPLPGFDVTEPTNCEFFLKGHLEGRPTQEYRSTVWPRLYRRYQAGGPAMISGPFGHGD
jgi:pilus assembly protein CpaC